MGVSIRTAASTDDWRAFYRVYDVLIAKMENPSSIKVPTGSFDVIARRNPAFRLWPATHGDVIIAGALYVYAKRHAAMSWCRPRGYFHLRPVNS